MAPTSLINTYFYCGAIADQKSLSFHSLKPNFHRLCTALCLAVIDRFDIIAIGIEDKGGVIAGVIDPLAGGAVILAAMGQRCLIEAIDCGAVLRLEGEVMATGQCAERCRAVDGSDKQLVSPEVTLTRAADWHIEGGQYGPVKALAGGQVFHHQLEMVDQPTPMQCVRFHTFTPLDMVESVTYLLPVVPFGDATALNVSFQLAAIDQKGVVGMAHGRLRRGVCCQLAILTARERRERRKWRIAGQDQQMEVSPKAWRPGWIGERGRG